MTTFELTGTFVAPFTGVVLMTVGAVSAAFAVTERSSIAKAWSLPVWSMFIHRSQTSCPLLIVIASVADLEVRLAALFRRGLRRL